MCMYIHQTSIGWPYAFACASVDNLPAGCSDTWDMGPEMNYINICEMEQTNQDTVPLQESAELFLARATGIQKIVFARAHLSLNLVI